MRELAQPNRGQRRLAGWLEDDGIACRQGGRHLPAGDREGKVPRHDGGDGSHGLAQSKIKTTPRHRNGLATEFGDSSGIVFKDARPELDFVTGIGDWFADVPAFELGERFGILPNQTGDVKQYIGALSRRQVTPAFHKSTVRPFHRFTHIVQGSSGDFGEDLFGSRIGLRDSPAVTGVAQCAIDEQLGEDLSHSTRCGGADVRRRIPIPDDSAFFRRPLPALRFYFESYTEFCSLISFGSMVGGPVNRWRSQPNQVAAMASAPPPTIQTAC